MRHFGSRNLWFQPLFQGVYSENAPCFQFYLSMKHCFEFFRGVDMEGGSASEQAESTDETDETEAMVAMEMGDKDGTEFGETYFRAAKLNMRTLAAVYHEELFA